MASKLSFVISILLLLILCNFNVYGQRRPDPNYVNAYNTRGFEVIFANDTSFLEKINVHSRGDILYVSGDGIIREVNEAPTFQVAWAPRYFAQNHRFIDFATFDDNKGRTWVFGPISAVGIDGDVSINHPLQIANQTVNDTVVLDGYVLSSVAIGAAEENSTVNAYLAGWKLRDDGAGKLGEIEFVVVKANVAPANIGIIGTPFVTVKSTLGLGIRSYNDYYRTFQPWIFVGARETIYVVDPSSRNIFKIHAPLNGTLSLVANISIGGSISGVTFDALTGLIYIGRKSSGIYPGSIVVINTTDLVIARNITLDLFEGNPVAMDLRLNELYVGLYGLNSIIRIDTRNGNITGYATLPDFLGNIHDIVATRELLYFVTYEQIAKIARVSFNNFCRTYCDGSNGFCQFGRCACVEGFHLSTLDNRTCLISPPPTPKPSPTNPPKNNEESENNKSEKGGEIALGLLFAIAVVGGVVGWVIVWRERRGKGGNGRYSLANREEGEGFISGAAE